MIKGYGNQPSVEYTPSTGMLKARLFLGAPNLESELENIIFDTFGQIGILGKTETLTHKTINYFLKEDPSLKKSVLEQFAYSIARVFSTGAEENKPVCIVQEIYDQTKRAPRLDIEVNLPIAGPDAGRNREIIQNLGKKLELIYQKTQMQYLHSPDSGI